MGKGIETDRVIVWEPQEKQRIAISCPAYELFYGGARGGGKSDFLLADFLQGVDEYGPAHRGVLFRRTNPELEELKIRSREIYIPLGAEWHESKNIWTFPSGSTLRLRYLDRDADVHRYQGHQYTWLGFDELTNWPSGYSYNWLETCARSAKGVPVRKRASGNPGGKGHAWVKHRFIDAAPPMTIYTDPQTGLDRVYIPAKLWDNTILVKNDPNYEKRLRMLPEKLQRAYLDGDWDIFIGQVFEEFRREKHIIKPFALDPNWFRFVSYDYGYTKPFSLGWWAVTGDGRMIRYKEWYGCEDDKANKGLKLPISEVARKAWEMSAPDGVRDMVADPSIWTNQKGEGKSIAAEFESVGFRMHRGRNDRLSGLQQMHDYLTNAGGDGIPMMVAFENCRAWARLIPAQIYSERHPEDVDTDGEDHIYDETRYAVMSRLAKKIRGRKPARRESFNLETQNNRADWNPFDYV